MASDTAPAAVPGPNQDSATPTSPPPAGGLTGLLAPVEPARSAAFTLDPATATQNTDGHDQATAGATSSAFHNPDQPDNANSAGGNTIRQERSVVRAWLLAGADRWKKSGDARLKRLDIQKAKAQARQVKETVTVNRSEKIGGGTGNSPTGSKSDSGKSLVNKTNKTPVNGPKNSPGSGGNGSAGRSNNAGSGGRGSSGGNGSTSSSGRGSAGRQGHGSSGGTDRSKKSREKTSGGQSGVGGGTSGTGGSGSSPKASRAGSDSAKPQGKDSGSSTSPKPDSNSGKNTGGSSGSGSSVSGKTGPQGTPGRPGKDGNAPVSKTSGGNNGSGPDDDKQAGKTSKTDLEKKPTTPGGKDTQQGDTDPKQNPDKSAPGTDTKDGKDRPRQDNQPTQQPNRAQRPRINTQPSREAGYRDGARAATVIAHTQAWRDGARDGYLDTLQAAEREKARLDQAHADRIKARTQPEDQPMTEPASSADHHPPTQTIPPMPDHTPGPHPIPVTDSNDTHIQLGDGADRTTISRGEVRTLHSFQTRLGHKNDRMNQVTDITRVLEQHASEQAKQVTQYLEQAKAVEGGDKLAAALTELEEAATIQASKAADVHKRALRAAEGVRSLATNTDTRYGDIYKAVIDSDETAPAKLSYYREMTHA